MRLGFLTLLLAARVPAVAQNDAAALLAKAVAAFENNQKNEKHWNWNIVETRQLLNRSGEIL
ncbi:MAG: hypothetical protein NTW28_06520, partial [Candidatus Solibacter sp.]|nr:hypothetical protein [Candidatus Solibacter sp.]